MTAAPDCELVSAYAAQGSEAAFRALVQRHVDLVYATALRQVGDAGLAEEITQNVFVTLARKAPRLAGIETLAGWLHRTAVLESKTRIRSELRRRRREQAAFELGQLQHEDASPATAMLPLLDEALLSLRESDRLALMLRFLEDRSLREVGAAIGVDEDAARKRVSRALDRLNIFFRKKGFTTGAATTGVTVLTSAAKAAPASLSVSATNAGLAAGGAATGLNLVLFHLMALTKTQTIVLCALVAAAPLAWQSHVQARIAREQADLNTELFAAESKATDLEKNLGRTRENLRLTRNEIAANQSRLPELNAQLTNRAPGPVYHWDDSSPVVRVPKELLATFRFAAINNHRGRLSDEIKQTLQFTEAETESVQSSINRFLAAYQIEEAAHMHRVEPKPEDLNHRRVEDTRVFEMQSIGDRLKELRQTFFTEVESTIGPERFKRFKAALYDWMPADDGLHGFTSGMTVFNFDRRVRFYKPAAGAGWFFFSISATNGGTSLDRIDADDIPDVFRPHLQDWITEAQTRPAAN